MKDIGLNHPQLVCQFRNQTIKVGQRIGNQKHNNNKMVEISSDQLPLQGYDKQNMTGILHRFYRQVTYDIQLQAYAFTNYNVLIPVETSMYIIVHEPTRRSFRYNPKTMQFRQVKGENCDWTTRYLSC